MAECAICKRKHRIGVSRSHSMVATKRKFKVNLQTKRINGKKIKICTRCIKKMSKIK